MPQWQPVEPSERYQVLDLIRGVALFGVLLVNLLCFFRVSLFTYIFADHGGIIDRFVSTALEFKALDLFSISFGVGLAIQAKNGPLFLVRRFLILFAFGAAQMTLVSNVDILCLYAVCGLALIPLARARWQILLGAGVAAVLLQPYVPGPALPAEEVLRAHGIEATRVYAQAGFVATTVYRWHETVVYIVPILAGILLKTCGLMLGGMALWRAGVIRDRDRHRRGIWIACAVAAAAWAVTREHIPLAIAYGAALLAWRQSERAKRWTAAFAAAGRMAFTNYLMQSLILATVFYGFGLIGHVDTVAAAAFGVALYAAQVSFSQWWLARHRFGPFEWVWRSLTYGRRV